MERTRLLSEHEIIGRIEQAVNRTAALDELLEIAATEEIRVEVKDDWLEVLEEECGCELLFLLDEI